MQNHTSQSSEIRSIIVSVVMRKLNGFIVQKLSNLEEWDCPPSFHKNMINNTTGDFKGTV